MKQFKTIAMIKKPLPLVWDAVRDELADWITHIDDIESVKCEQNLTQPNGDRSLVNRWTAKVKIPQALQNVVSARQIAWLDRAVWSEKTRECRWIVQPLLSEVPIKCHGVTQYAQAMGGRGTRMTFSGSINVEMESSNVPRLLQGSVERGVEAFLGSLIPKNFQNISHAVETHLNTRLVHASAVVQDATTRAAPRLR